MYIFVFIFLHTFMQIINLLCHCCHIEWSNFSCEAHEVGHHTTQLLNCCFTLGVCMHALCTQRYQIRAEREWKEGFEYSFMFSFVILYWGSMVEQEVKRESIDNTLFNNTWTILLMEMWVWKIRNGKVVCLFTFPLKEPDVCFDE